MAVCISPAQARNGLGAAGLVEQLPFQALFLVGCLGLDAGAQRLVLQSVFSRSLSRPGAEYQELGQGIGAQAVGAVDAHTGHFAGSEQSLQGRGSPDVGVDAAHHVVDHRADRNQLAHRIDVLVLEAKFANKGQLGVDDLPAQVGEVRDGRRARKDPRMCALCPTPS